MPEDVDKIEVAILVLFLVQIKLIFLYSAMESLDCASV